MSRGLAERYRDTHDVDDVVGYLRDRTNGRGPDAAIDAVGMEAHGNLLEWGAQQAASKLPPALGEPMAKNFGVDRLSALTNAIYAVRRGGTVSLSGVYAGAIDPLPMVDIFDRQLTLRHGQCNVKRWVDDIMPHLTDDADPLGTEDLATHHLPLDEAPHGYDIFQHKQDNRLKVVLKPEA